LIFYFSSLFSKRPKPLKLLKKSKTKLFLFLGFANISCVCEKLCGAVLWSSFMKLFCRALLWSGFAELLCRAILQSYFVERFCGVLLQSYFVELLCRATL
jgi:hypothetical protein